MWVLSTEVEYEGSGINGVFSTAVRAMRAIDKLDPPTKSQKWIKWASEPVWTRRRGPYGSEYQVTRYNIDESLV